MAATFNPQNLTDLAEFWKANGGKNLGIAGDAKHMARGVSYHLGKDDLLDTAYSIQSKRDRRGLTNAASAIDLGRLRTRLENLRAFSKWLVDQCMADSAARKDIREIIYSLDGTKVQRYSGIDNKIHRGPGNGDLSHRTHTHISYFRDSEMKEKILPFRPFFDVRWAPGVPAELVAVNPGAMKVALAIRRAGHEFGSFIDEADLVKALTLVGHPLVGGTARPADVVALIDL